MFAVGEVHRFDPDSECRCKLSFINVSFLYQCSDLVFKSTAKKLQKDQFVNLKCALTLNEPSGFTIRFLLILKCCFLVYFVLSSCTIS